MNHAIAGVLPALRAVRREHHVELLEKITRGCAEAGLTVAGVESHPVSPFARQRLRRPIVYLSNMPLAVASVRLTPYQSRSRSG